MTGDAEVLVVGGGPAGASAAALLARAGKRVVLIERSAAPHDKVCGDFLSAEAVSHISALGEDLHKLGAVPIRTLRLAAGKRRVEIDLPFHAVSLSRRILDEALLRRAEACGAQIMRGAAVRDLSGRAGAWRAAIEGGATIAAAEAFLATGKHDLRGRGRPRGMQSDLIGFKMHMLLERDSAAALDGAVELILFPGGYAGVQPLERGRVNLCLLVKRAEYAQLGRDWDSLLAMIRRSSKFAESRLAGAESCSEKPLAVGLTPFGHVRRSGRDGLWRLGDQAAVVPSYSGMGVSLALHSAGLAAAAYLANADAAQYQRRLARDVGRIARLGSLVSILFLRPWSQAALLCALQRFPGLLEAGASVTRLPAATARPPVTFLSRPDTLA